MANVLRGVDVSTSLPPEGSIEYDHLSQASLRITTPSSNPIQTVRFRLLDLDRTLEGGVSVYPSEFGRHFSKGRSWEGFTTDFTGRS